MAAQTQALTVSFYGNSLYIVEHNGEPYTPMKPIVKGMGIDWTGQFVKLRNQKEKFGCRDISIPSVGGIQEMLCIPLRKLSGWLFSINPAKVKESIRPKVIQYQEECFVVLHDYWTKGEATNPRNTTVDERTPLRAAVEMLVGKKALKHPDAYAIVHQRFGVTSIDQLSLEQIPQAVEYVHRLVLEGEVLPAEETWAINDLPKITMPPLDNQVGLNGWLTYKELVHMKQMGQSPLSRLLRELSLRGYDVSAARFEYDGWRHCLEMASNSLESIAMSANILNRTGLHVNLCR